MNEDREPKTAGIPPAKQGALAVLQFWENPEAPPKMHELTRLAEAVLEVSRYHQPVGTQEKRHGEVAGALATFLEAICVECPPGPERSTAISRAREAKMWASAAIALEGK